MMEGTNAPLIYACLLALYDRCIDATPVESQTNSRSDGGFQPPPMLDAVQYDGASRMVMLDASNNTPRTQPLSARASVLTNGRQNAWLRAVKTWNVMGPTMCRDW